MEAVNPCNKKEECFPSQGNVTHGQAVVRSPARRAPPAHTSYSPFLWPSSPRTSTRPAAWSRHVTTPARPWEAQLQTLPLHHQPVPASFPTAGDFSDCWGFCRGGRVRREDGVAQRDEAGRSFWLGVPAPCAVIKTIGNICALDRA